MAARKAAQLQSPNSVVGHAIDIGPLDGLRRLSIGSAGVSSEWGTET
jgi:hypothetical protein